MSFARYSYRIEPTPIQREHLAKLFGCVRRVWNDALEYCRAERHAGRSVPNGNQLSRWLTEHKRSRSWLAAAPSTPLQECMHGLGAAWKHHRTTPARVQEPKFHQKRARQSARFTRRTFRVSSSGLSLQKIPGEIRVRWSRSLPNPPTSVVVLLEPTGHYSASFTVQVTGATSCVLQPQATRTVGIDLGVAAMASLSNGEQYSGVAASDLERRIRQIQRQLARSLSSEGRFSNRGERLRQRIARLHGAVRARRTNALHLLSTDLVKRFDLIVLEDLQTASLVRKRTGRGRAAKRGLNRAISQMGWGQFRRMLGYKAERCGKRLLTVPAQGTSQRCSCCGTIDARNRVSRSRFRCQSCGHTENADINAAKNILAAGQAAAGQGAGVSPPQQVAAG